MRKRKRKGFCGAKSVVNSGVTGSSTAADDNIDLAIEPVGVTEVVVGGEAVPETSQGSKDIPLEGGMLLVVSQYTLLLWKKTTRKRCPGNPQEAH